MTGTPNGGICFPGTMETARPVNPQLLLAHESFVRAVARSLLADESRAEDVVQDTWLAALRSPPDGGRGASDAGRLRSWLARVARNFARQERRGSIRRGRRERATAKRELIPSAAEIVEIEAARKRLVEAVLALEEPVRSAVLLRFYRDLPPRAIARELGLPVETVRSRIKRGIHQLRERLGAGDGGVSFFRAAPFLAVARLPVAEVAAGSSVAATAFTTGALLMESSTKVAALVLILLGGLAVLLPRPDREARGGGREEGTPEPPRAPT